MWGLVLFSFPGILRLAGGRAVSGLLSVVGAALAFPLSPILRGAEARGQGLLEGTQGICAVGCFQAICRAWHSIFSR